jgi:hypothetical protein
MAIKVMDKTHNIASFWPMCNHDLGGRNAHDKKYYYCQQMCSKSPEKIKWTGHEIYPQWDNFNFWSPSVTLPLEVAF